jgi:hypothetical protein
MYGGDERKYLKMVPSIKYIREERGIPVPMIHVFVNGDEVSFYNYPAKKSMAEDVFIEEMIPPSLRSG